MSTKDDWNAALIAGGAVAAGIWGLSALQRGKQKREFLALLEQLLDEVHIELVSAELAGLPQGGRAWDLTVEDGSHGLLTFWVELEPDVAPYTYDTAEGLVESIHGWLEGQEAVR